MPSNRMETFTLTRHPAARSNAAQQISGRVSRRPGGTLMITYIIEGDIDRMRVPAQQRQRFADDLWRHTCCELFIARAGQPAYYEFNFSPSGEWALYAFERERQRMPLTADINVDEMNPYVTVCRAENKLELDAVIHLNRLSPLYATAKLALGLSAVVEDQDGSLSYWALQHPLDKPDFHHPDVFVLELDEVRN